jgi:hypothetical protein
MICSSCASSTSPVRASGRLDQGLHVLILSHRTERASTLGLGFILSGDSHTDNRPTSDKQGHARRSLRQWLRSMS